MLILHRLRRLSISRPSLHTRWKTTTTTSTATHAFSARRGSASGYTYSDSFSDYLKPLPIVDPLKEEPRTATMLLEVDPETHSTVETAILIQVDTDQTDTQPQTQTQSKVRKCIKLAPTSVFDHFPRYKHTGLTLCFTDERAFRESYVHPADLMTRNRNTQNLATMQHPTELKALDYMFKTT